MKRNLRPEQIWTFFEQLNKNCLASYRDATFSEPEFLLTLIDCWRGLNRGIQNGFVCKLNPEEYAHYDDPLNGDLHIVVPGRFVAFKGPKSLPNGREYLDHNGVRDFSPTYYVDIFKEIGVTDVVRLNEPEYDEEAFLAAGIAHHDLEFEDCTAPPDAVVSAFLRIVDGAKGLVAVHCKAGLGRTGTLIALDLMRTHGFTAREAMGSQRIMRPGSVIGEQQRYLCEVDRSLSRAIDITASFPATAAAPAAAAAAADACSNVGKGTTLTREIAAKGRQRSGRSNGRPTPMPTTAAGAAAAGSAELARQVAEAMNRRAASRILARR